MAEGKTTNILMAGVGGQGVILASEIVSEALMRAGYDVKKSEVHGMAQRGGSVTTHVRFGKKVYSPLIPDGEVDILFSFELLETMRYLHLLSQDPVIVVNNQKVLPPSVLLGSDKYPENIPALLAERYRRFYLVNALDIARSAGNPKTLNVVFVAALSRLLDLSESIWQEAIQAVLPQKLIELNVKAFLAARQTFQTQ